MSDTEEIQRPIKIKREVHFMIGEIVYLKAELSQYPRIVVGYAIGEIGAAVNYILRYSDEGTSEHTEAEISLTQDILMKQSNMNNEEDE